MSDIIEIRRLTTPWPRDLSIIDWNPYLKEVSRTRTIRVRGPLPCPEGVIDIQHVLSHQPILPEGNLTVHEIDKIAKSQLVTIIDEPWVDEFGFYIYLKAIPTIGPRKDLDMRYDENTNPEPEIFTVI